MENCLHFETASPHSGRETLLLTRENTTYLPKSLTTSSFWNSCALKHKRNKIRTLQTIQLKLGHY
jgi:hypothetical protein